MIFKKRGDLVFDQYSNYYYITKQNGDVLTLVNAFADLTFRRRLDDIYYEEFSGQYIGDRPLELLKGNIDMIINNKSKLKLYALEKLEKEYDVVIEPVTELPVD